MSVYKEQRIPGEFYVLTLTRWAAEYSIHITNNREKFPIRSRYSVVERIQRNAIEMYSLALEANEILPTTRLEADLRHGKQAEAIAKARAILSMANMCVDLYGISAGRLKYWTEKIMLARNHLKHWMDTDEERYKKLE